MEKRLTSVEANFNGLNLKVGVLESRVQDMQSIQKEIQHNVGEQKQATTELNGSFNQLLGAVNRIEQANAESSRETKKFQDSMRKGFTKLLIAIVVIISAIPELKQMLISMPGF